MSAVDRSITVILAELDTAQLKLHDLNNRIDELEFKKLKDNKLRSAEDDELGELLERRVRPIASTAARSKGKASRRKARRRPLKPPETSTWSESHIAEGHIEVYGARQEVQTLRSLDDPAQEQSDDR